VKKPYRIVLAAVVAGSLALGGSGCGSAGAAKPGAATVENHALEEVGRIFRTYQKGRRPPPKSVADFNLYEQGYPLGVGAIKRKEVVVFWGGGLSDASDAASTVLAYEASAPASGGAVLTQDGTVRKMSADEFKAAAKAGTLAKN
jgi:hypothetical protein